MKLYDKYIVPALIRLVCSNPRFTEMRQSLLPKARGNVLEIGIGSGLNLPFYDHSSVTHIVGLEPSEQLRQHALKKINALNIPVEILPHGAENIPLESRSIDTIVTTFTLCSITEIQRALEEMRRVLKPDGELLFCEHGRAPEQQVQRWQDRINPYWKKMAGGCNVNRDIHTLILQAGFLIEEPDHQYMQGPKTFSYIYKGFAKPA